MRRDELVGTWRIEGTDTLIELRDDGSGWTYDAGRRPQGMGSTWSWESHDRFTHTYHVPGFPGSSHNPDGYDEAAIYSVLEQQPGRMTLLIVEDEAGFDYDPVVWTREGTASS